MTHEEDFGELSPQDSRLLDALVEAGFDRGAVPVQTPEERRRLDAIGGLFELLDDYPVADVDEALVPATIARINRQEREAAGRLVFDAARVETVRRVSRRIRVPDFISIAAVILIAASIVVPTATHMRRRALDAGCASNLRVVGQAFAGYAADYDGSLPTVVLGTDLMSWDKVRNWANLRVLMERGYCDQGHLQCPGNHEHAEPGYSYQWLGSRPRTLARSSDSILVGDRNPLIDAAQSGRAMPPLSMSLNHGGRGQNVLLGDGSQDWLEEPLHRGRDNIWLPLGVYFLRPGDGPSDPADVFLAH